MMTRTSLNLPPELLAQLKAEARSQGRSWAGLVRHLVTLYLQQQSIYRATVRHPQEKGRHA